MTKVTDALRLRITKTAFELTVPRTVLALILAAVAAIIKAL